jgi:hypothetical protein
MTMMRWSTGRARIRRGVGAVVLVGLLVACSGDDDAVVVEEPPSEPTEASPTPDEEERWPLTGLLAPSGVADRPALVVKVDNTAGARPQLGLADADLIIEEPVEGGLTRLAGMFHAALPEVVAPVRSLRTSDIGIVAPTGGALVASGGAERVLRMIDDAEVTVLTEGDAGIGRDPSRRAPYNVTVDLAATLDNVSDLDVPSIPYLEWAPGAEVPTGGTPVTSADIVFSAVHTTSWDWNPDEDVWSRRHDLAEPGQAFTPANVLVLHVVTRDAGYTDPAGNPVDEVVFDEPGDALLLTGGVAVAAAWMVDGDVAAFGVSDEVGDGLSIPPGKTWIALVPERGSVTMN